jgi:replication factor A2
VIEAKQWIDMNNSDDSSKMDTDSKSKLVEEGYCRVWGRLKSFNNKRHVGAHIIRPVTDYNEINYHFLEATAVHLFFSRGPPSNAANGQHKAGMSNGAGATRNGEYESNTGGHLAHMTPVARRVFNTMKSMPQSNEGLHVQVLANNLNLSASDVYKAAEELVASGLIFTTVDDDTWAVMDT